MFFCEKRPALHVLGSGETYWCANCACFSAPGVHVFSPATEAKQVFRMFWVLKMGQYARIGGYWRRPLVRTSGPTGARIGAHGARPLVRGSGGRCADRGERLLVGFALGTGHASRLHSLIQGDTRASVGRCSRRRRQPVRRFERRWCRYGRPSKKGRP